MKSFTLDTNCLIAIEEKRDGRAQLLELVRLASLSQVDVAIVASSASEKQITGSYLLSYGDFKHRLVAAGLGNLGELYPLARYNISYWDKSVWASEASSQLEQDIFSALFPGTANEWKDYAYSKGISEADTVSRHYQKWRNMILDAQMFWAHEFHARDVFVTSDQNFSKRLSGVDRFRERAICHPTEVLSHLGE